MKIYPIYPIFNILELRKKPNSKHFPKNTHFATYEKVQ